jgi:putative addiction module killer protein
MTSDKQKKAKKAPPGAAPKGLHDSNKIVTIELREYLDSGNASAFGSWFERLDAAAAAKIAVHLKRIELGNFSNVEPVGEGVSEKKIDWGPGYRIYFGRDGAVLVILLGGSFKADQDKAIKAAKVLWQDYKQRKRSKLHGTH